MLAPNGGDAHWAHTNIKADVPLKDSNLGLIWMYVSDPCGAYFPLFKHPYSV